MGHIAGQYHKIFAVFVLLAGVASCTPTVSKPADPANTWLKGNWTTGDHGWRQDLALQVGDGNRVVGTFANTDPQGVTSDGTVDGEVNGDQLSLYAAMSSGPSYTIKLTRNGKLLKGTRSSSRNSWNHVFYKK